MCSCYDGLGNALALVGRRGVPVGARALGERERESNGENGGEGERNMGDRK